MRTVPTNPVLQKLVEDFRKEGWSRDIALFKRIAEDLEKPTRQRRIVNISRINHYARDNEYVIVPGKVLGEGNLEKPITIAAFSFSKSALRAIKEANAKAVELSALLKEDVKGKRMRLLG
jgi:large subunit ribosomal protein L18e